MESNIEKLYNRYGPMVLRRCRQLLRDEESAKEAMQDVFIQVIQNRLHLDLSSSSSLLYCMATNICLNLLRKRKRINLSSSCVDDEILLAIATDENVERNFDIQQTLQKLFGRHSKSTRVIATLHYYDGLTLQEVANEVGMSLSGVRKRLRLFHEKIETLKNEFND